MQKHYRLTGQPTVTDYASQLIRHGCSQIEENINLTCQNFLQFYRLNEKDLFWYNLFVRVSQVSKLSGRRRCDVIKLRNLAIAFSILLHYLKFLRHYIS